VSQLGLLAFQSDRSGIFEVYVRRYPENDQEVRVSEGGGVEPTWSHDGRELLYRTADTIKVVEANEQPPLFGTPRTSVVAAQYDFTEDTNWDIGPGGRLVMVKADPTKGRRFTVIQHFAGELRRRVRE
jgi:Tol biopolymer transport system component